MEGNRTVSSILMSFSIMVSSPSITPPPSLRATAVPAGAGSPSSSVPSATSGRSGKLPESGAPRWSAPATALWASGALRPRAAVLPSVTGAAGAAATGARPVLSDAAWERIAMLPPAQRQRLNARERETLAAAVHALRRHIEAEGLDFIPVFGHWSLRTDNYRELGKASQDEVQEGRDTVPARIGDYGMDFVASTEYRGRPQHPGAVASIAPSPGSQVPGTLLKLPFDRAEELLTVLLMREIGAEADLRAPPDAQGRPRSSLMYQPAVRPVTLQDGSTVHALLFETNPDGAKSLRRTFGDEAELTAGRLAFFIAGEGGFVRDGKRYGGPSADYWRAGMQRLEASGDAPDPLLAEAYRIATSSRSADGSLSLDAMVGAAVPRGTWHGHQGWLGRAEARLPAVYARPRSPAALAAHQQHQRALDTALSAWLSGDGAGAVRSEGGDLRTALAHELPALLKGQGFDPAVYAASAMVEQGYGRHLLYSESDARSGMQGLFSLQAVAFDVQRYPQALAHPEVCAAFDTPEGIAVAVFLHRGIDGVSGGLELPLQDPFAAKRWSLH
ncbi:Cation transport regulator ChaC [Paracidovorax cattleyae]|uniref:Cation transport regulator ChaC n=3 Tax=Paracidovorax cattleyae TaxID=80868 RepID=A0A1H0PED1_9BURK|nr:Cation transport regulator ChaC [Paracidovorax cattleyae]